MVAPLGALGPDLRSLQGRVLSIGCGHAMVDRYIAEINGALEIDGIDVDPSRVRVAGQTPGHPRVSVREGDAAALDGGQGYDGALAFDVMHHIDAGEHAAVADGLARSVRAGGTCLVKDIATRPHWKHEFNRLHDRLVAGPEPVHCRSPREMAEVFSRAGFEPLSASRIGRLGPYPHYLLRLRRC